MGFLDIGLRVSGEIDGSISFGRQAKATED